MRRSSGGVANSESRSNQMGRTGRERMRKGRKMILRESWKERGGKEKEGRREGKKEEKKGKRKEGKKEEKQQTDSIKSTQGLLLK